MHRRGLVTSPTWVVELSVVVLATEGGGKGCNRGCGRLRHGAAWCGMVRRVVTAKALSRAAGAAGGDCAELRTESFGKFPTETDDAASPGAPPSSTDELGARLSHLHTYLHHNTL
ncbi:jg684 [Pararge aegeria aegeria]|uniref:Jg684 protein n=1 Tax=Pararge aegeria aegeria TaxID=348720 RepID=A0A8S4QGN6_9NEOP|nr:jg684 [Pararge aegeria aegeria]